eukprot:2879895-Alexandrium_andersonii.AAC.1
MAAASRAGERAGGALHGGTPEVEPLRNAQCTEQSAIHRSIILQIGSPYRSPSCYIRNGIVDPPPPVSYTHLTLPTICSV